MRVAALDLGTNTFLCLIAEVEGGQITKVYDDQVRVVRLGQDVNKTKAFHPEALVRAKACLTEFSKVIESHRPERVLAMATSAARDVTNSQLLFQIGRDLKIPIEIIPGGREAEITFQGATSHLPKDHKRRVVIDVGGGSTEYILGSDHKVQMAESVDIGCVRLTESHISHQPTPQEDLTKLSSLVLSKIERITQKIKSEQVDEVIAVAGTPSAIAAIEVGGFSVEKVDGYSLSQEALTKWLHTFAGLSVDEKIQKFGIEKGRADVILVGTLILQKSLEALGQPKMLVSTKGVRFGVALEVASRPAMH